MQKTIISFLGAPGAGKGTLAQQCVQALGFKALSTGTLFRDAAAKQDTRGTLIAQYLNAGQLLPDDMVTDIVYDWLTDQVDDTPIILDGYPRTKAQAEKFLSMLAAKLPQYVFRVVALKVPDEVIIQRLAHRLICSRKECQKVYNDSQFPDTETPVCPSCRGTLARRQDDRPEVVAQRLAIYAQHSIPLFDFYEQHGKKAEMIEADSLSREAVFAKFKALVDL